MLPLYEKSRKNVLFSSKKYGVYNKSKISLCYNTRIRIFTCKIHNLIGCTRLCHRVFFSETNQTVSHYTCTIRSTTLF